ncbi:unnamed protein product [Gadus morhua 'NCC']
MGAPTSKHICTTWSGGAKVHSLQPAAVYRAAGWRAEENKKASSSELHSAGRGGFPYTEPGFDVWSRPVSGSPTVQNVKVYSGGFPQSNWFLSEATSVPNQRTLQAQEEP